MELKNLDNVPLGPGVYIWKDKENNVIYVGKAKSLQKRMKQYFKGMLNSYKTAKLVEKIHSFEYFIVSSERESLVLERNLIEKYSPEYNILLTDDKRYPYIRIQLLDKLYVQMIYRVKSQRDNELYYGPFPTGYGARKMVNLISRLVLYDKGILIEKASREQWKDKFKIAKEILSVSSASLIKNLTKQMIEAAQNEQFENAQDIKETIEAINLSRQKQNVEFLKNQNIDVIGFVLKDYFLSVSMFFYRQGMLLTKKDIVLEIVASKEETINQFISQYYNSNIIPDLIISNEFLETEIKMLNPQKGKKKEILDVVLKNAQDNIDLKLKEFIRKEELTFGALKILADIVGLQNVNHILMIDNSNTNNTSPVSVIVSFRNGLKTPTEYRKYSLEQNARLADVEYMVQGVTKYFSNDKNVIPDLFIVDGGKAQVNAVKNFVPKGLPIMGLVKDDKHRTREIVLPNGTLVEIESQNLFNLLQKMQDEVDRYAKSFHRSKRQTTLEGKLLSISGVGHVVEKKLLNHFKNYASIYNASIEELSEVVSLKIAHAIKKELGQ